MVRIHSNVDEYVKKGVVAVGWSKVPFDPQDIELTIKKINIEYYQNSNQSVSGRKRNEVKKFLEIREKDLIIVPCYKGFYIGKSTGEFVHDSSLRDIDLSNQLKVDFLKDNDGNPLYFTRAGKITALQTKLGVRGFTILKIDEPEIQESIQKLAEQGIDCSETSYIAKKENDSFIEFKRQLRNVLQDYKKTSLESKGIGFEKLIAELFSSDGYKTNILSKKIGDDKADADILAVKECGFSSKFNQAYYIQAKHHSGKTDLWGLEQIKSFKAQQSELGSITFKTSEENEDNIVVFGDNIKYVLITSAEFSSDYSEENEEIIFIDGNELAEMLFEKIDDMNDEIRYQLGFIKKYEFSYE